MSLGYKNRLSLSNRAARAIWNVVWLLLVRPMPGKPGFHTWTRLWLRVFGARLASSAIVHPSVRVWAPWNLDMGVGACIGPHVDCYDVAPIRIGDHVTVSQRAFLCSASHDIDDPEFLLVSAPIRLEDRAWVAAEAYVGPGVTLGTGAVAAARAVVVKDVAAWDVVGGNPARVISRRAAREACQKGGPA
jgi:putative colanic acid biosynthesis acetyltransferase WcaF